jgi:hypothetical protein
LGVDPEQARLQAFLASDDLDAMLRDPAHAVGRAFLLIVERTCSALGLGSMYDPAPPGAVEEVQRQLVREDDGFLAAYWGFMQELSASSAAHGLTLEPRHALARLTGLPAEELARRLLWELPTADAGAGGPATAAEEIATLPPSALGDPARDPRQLPYGLRELPPEAPAGFAYVWEDDDDGLETEEEEAGPAGT